MSKMLNLGEIANDIPKLARILRHGEQGGLASGTPLDDPV